MEARAGRADRAKAERLVSRYRTLFRDMFAHFHTPNEFAGECAGKSSNAASSYNAIQRYLDRFGGRLLVKPEKDASVGETNTSYRLELAVSGPGDDDETNTPITACSSRRRATPGGGGHTSTGNEKNGISPDDVDEDGERRSTIIPKEVGSWDFLTHTFYSCICISPRDKTMRPLYLPCLVPRKSHDHCRTYCDRHAYCTLLETQKKLCLSPNPKKNSAIKHSLEGGRQYRRRRVGRGGCRCGTRRVQY